MSEWKQVRLGEVVEVVAGPAFKSEVFRSATEGPRLLRGMNLGPVGIRWPEGETFCWPPDRLDGYKKYELRVGDVCVAMDATFTRSGSLRGGTIGPDDLPALLVQRVARLRPRDAQLLPGFVSLVVTSQLFRNYLTDRQTGAFAPHVSSRDLQQFPLSLPTRAQQRRMVDLFQAVDAQIEALDVEAEALACVYSNSVNLLWQDETGAEASPSPLAAVMSLDIQRTTLDSATRYQIAGVLNAGQGLIDKGSLSGSQTGYSAMNRLHKNQVVMRKLTAWEGPIAVVPNEFDGYLASNEFPTFSLGDAVEPDWMRHVCRTGRLWAEMRSRVTGTVQRRKRLNPEQLLAVELPIPDRSSQRRVAAGLDALVDQRTLIVAERDALRGFRSALLASLLDQTVTVPESYDDLLEVAS